MPLDCREPRQSAKIGFGIAARFHAVADRVNRLGRLDRLAIALVVLDNQLKKIGCGWGNSIVLNIQDCEASSSRASFKSSLNT
jgi:hypothetical protein